MVSTLAASGVMAAMVSPCTIARPLDSGEIAPCDGVLISAGQARAAVKDREELKVRRAFACPECPRCPACPEPRRSYTPHWTLAGVLTGIVLALTLRFGS